LPDGGGPLSDTLWEWHGSSWERLAPLGDAAGAVPPGRQDHALAYDSGRGRLVLHGGTARAVQGGHVDLGDTWEWDGQRWLRSAPEDPEGDGDPHRRHAHAMSYDVRRRRVVLVGGSVSVPGSPGDFTRASDVWEWDGVSWARRWRPEDGDGPEGRLGSALAWEPERERVLLYGGEGAGGAPLDALWAWDGATWTELHPEPASDGGRPAGLEDASMAFHAASGGLVLGGSATETGVWLLTGERWAHLPAHPEPISFGHLADGMLVGGSPEVGVLRCGGSAPVYLDESCRTRIGGHSRGSLWEGVLPARVEGGMAFADDRGTFVLFGGRCTERPFRREARPCGDTWELADGSWSQPVPRDPEGDGDPSARYSHALAYLSTTGETVLFGGSDDQVVFGDTWAWDGLSWRLAAAPGELAPSARVGHAMAVDPAGEHLLLYGGSSPEDEPLGDTWLWDGAAWEHAVPEDPEGDGGPGPRVGHALAEVGFERRRVLLAGGCRSELVAGEATWVCPEDVWAWDGSSWERIPVDDAEGDGGPLPRTGHAMAWDRDLERVVLVGGQHAGDTWHWTSDERYGPGHRWSVVPPAAALRPDVAWERLDVRFVARGFGEPDGARTTGVRLLLWEDGVYRELAEADAGLDGDGEPVLAPVEWTDDDGERLRRLPFGSRQTLRLALTTVAPAGTGSAELGVDYAEVRLRYRLGLAAPR